MADMDKEIIDAEVADAALGAKGASARRIRRMKALLTTMFKEEIKPKRPVVQPVKLQSVVIAVSAVAVLLLSMSSVYSYNLFINLEEQIFSNRGHVEAVLQRRANLFNNLVNIALNHATLEEDVYSHVADVRTKLNPGVKQALSALAGAGGAASAGDVGASLSRLLAVVEQYPEIQSAATYQQLMDKLMDLENTIAQRRAEYNESVRVFNQKITNFPWIVVSKLTGFKRHDYFESTGPGRANPVLSPTTYERLLPDSRPPKAKE
jgi:LemA protein